MAIYLQAPAKGSLKPALAVITILGKLAFPSAATAPSGPTTGRIFPRGSR